MPHEYADGETMVGLQEGPIVHGVASGVSGTVRQLVIGADGAALVSGNEVVENAIDSTAYDLNASAFSVASNIDDDFILNSVELNFSTAEEKTVTITTADGTKLYEDTNTSQSVSLTDINRAFNGAENFTVAVTQFVGAGTMDCVAVVTRGGSPILGGGANPVLGAGTSHIGQTGLKLWMAGDWHPAKGDASTQSIQTIEYEHHEIHSGSHYQVSGYQDLAINEVLDFTWLMPDTEKWIHWTWNISTESETLWCIYENAVATNPLANTITPINSNRNSANTSGTTMKYEVQNNLAAANADTAIGAATVMGCGISGAGKDAGSDKRTNELVLNQAALYCLRAEATAAGHISFHMTWYEHSDAL